MEDLNAKLEKLLMDAEDCDLVGRLAADPNKRELFEKLAADLRAITRDIQVVIAGGTNVCPQSDQNKVPAATSNAALNKSQAPPS
jgi:hypothetical protein